MGHDIKVCSAGTASFLLGTLALSLPGLLRNYNEEFRIALQPLEDYTYLQFTLNPLRIPKPVQLITHLYTHKNQSHFGSNYFTLAIHAYQLNLGLFRSTELFLFTGIFGALSQIAYITYQEEESLISHLHRSIEEYTTIDLRSSIGLPSTGRLYRLQGSSAAASGFLGAHIIDLYRAIALKHSKKYRKYDREKEEMLLAQMYLQTLVYTIQAFNLVSDCFVQSDGLTAHIAHMGGFLSGCVFSLIF